MNKDKKQTVFSWLQRKLFDQRRKSRTTKETYLIMYIKGMTKFNIIRVKSILGGNVCVCDYKNEKKCKEENIQLFILVTWREGKVKSEVR